MDEKGSTPASAEARTTRRFDGIVEVSIGTGHDFWTGLTANISTGGVFVVHPDPMPVGSRVGFHLRLGPDSPVHELTGEVRWVRSAEVASPGCPAGMGLRFLDLKPELVSEIEAWILDKDSLFYDDEDDDDE